MCAFITSVILVGKWVNKISIIFGKKNLEKSQTTKLNGNFSYIIRLLLFFFLVVILVPNNIPAMKVRLA